MIYKKQTVKLIILSDLFGFENSEWIQNYVDLLKTEFQLILYDSLELAEIDKSNLSEKEIHSQLINYGIENAVRKLLQLEKREINILAFSVGGTIAWKGGLENLKIEKLYAISATRLRYETKKPVSNIQLIYGLQDPFKPEKKWFEEMEISNTVMENGNHEIYKNLNFINSFCKSIIAEKNNSINKGSVQE